MSKAHHGVKDANHAAAESTRRGSTDCSPRFEASKSRSIRDPLSLEAVTRTQLVFAPCCRRVETNGRHIVRFERDRNRLGFRAVIGDRKTRDFSSRCILGNPEFGSRQPTNGLILDKHLETLARARLLLSAFAVRLHYHRDRLATGTRRHRPHRRHRHSQFVPEVATAVAVAATVSVTTADATSDTSTASTAATDAVAVTVLPTQNRQPIEGGDVGADRIASIATRSFCDRRRGARQTLQRHDDRSRLQRGQLYQHRADARVRPDVIQGGGTQHDDHPAGRVGMRTDLQAPCNDTQSSIRIRNLLQRWSAFSRCVFNQPVITALSPVI